MKHLLGLGLSLLSISAFSSQEMRFDPKLEEKCFAQVRKLQCGEPDKNEEAFFKCVDKKIGKLTPDCQSMHRSIASEHKGHDHSH